MKYDTAIPIGQGASGEVLKAWDPSLERYIALKLLKSDDDETVYRALREARAQARVNHPNVCKVFEVGTLDGRPYIAMELIEGLPLDEAAQDLPVERQVELVKTVAEAVQAAHSVGLVHRDLKPANILVDTTDDRPYVVDFGIVREHSAPGITMSGQMVGTPGYVSPEQARGEVHGLDRRSDVFSLGVILYELLAKRAPFAGESTVETLVNVLHHDPPRLREVARVPRDLETIVHCCLEKDPARRYASARALAEDLGRYLHGTSITARPISAAERLVRRVRRHPKTSSFIAAILVVFVVLAALVWRERRRADERQRLAQTFGQEVERIETALRRIYTLPPHDVRPHREAVRSRLERLRRRMASLGPVAAGPGHYALGRGHLALDEPAAARRELEAAWRAGYRSPEVAYALGRALGELYHEALDDVAKLAGEERREARRAELDQELRQPMMSYLQRARAAESESPSLVYGLTAFYEERWEDALRHAAKAFAEMPWLYGAKKLEGDALSRQAHRHQLDGKPAAAADHHRRARDAYAVALDIARSDPALYAAECRRRRRALVMDTIAGTVVDATFEEPLALCRRGLRADPDLAGLWLDISNIFWRWGEYLADEGQDPRAPLSEAIRAAERAIALDPGESSAYSSLATAYVIRAQYEAANGQSPLESLDRAIRATEQGLDLHPFDDWAHATIADAFLQRGRWLSEAGEDPRASFERSAASLAQAIKIRPIYAWYGNLARVQLELAELELRSGGDPVPICESAIANGRRALVLNPEYGGYRIHVAYGYLVLARALRKRGDDNSAAVGEGLALVERILDRHPEDEEALQIRRDFRRFAE